MAKRKYRKSKSSKNDALAKSLGYLFAFPFIAMFYMLKGFIWLCKKFYGSDLSWKVKLGGTVGVFTFILISAAIGGSTSSTNDNISTGIGMKNDMKDIVNRNVNYSDTDEKNNIETEYDSAIIEKSDNNEIVKEIDTEIENIITEPVIETESIIITEAVTEPVSEITTEPETEPVTEKEPEPVPAPVKRERVYWLNTDSGKYHYESCRTIKDGTTESYWQSTTDIDWLKSNYSSCGVCKPPK